MINFLKIINEADKRRTIAIVPGSMKPPTAGHWDMIQKYSKLADKVIVLVSEPGKSKRLTSNGTSISAETAIKILNMYKNVYGLKNVEIRKSKVASPIQSAYDFAEHDLKDVNVIFGSSTKGGDYKRWKTVSKYMDSHNPSITVMDPEKYAVKPLASGGVDISASDWRNNIDDKSIYSKYLPKKVASNDKLVDDIYGLLN
jgi:cytidyltransferase-like protein